MKIDLAPTCPYSGSLPRQQAVTDSSHSGARPRSCGSKASLSQEGWMPRPQESPAPFPRQGLTKAGVEAEHQRSTEEMCRAPSATLQDWQATRRASCRLRTTNPEEPDPRTQQGLTTFRSRRADTQLQPAGPKAKCKRLGLPVGLLTLTQPPSDKPPPACFRQGRAGFQGRDNTLEPSCARSTETCPSGETLPPLGHPRHTRLAAESRFQGEGCRLGLGSACLLGSSNCVHFFISE